MSLTLIEEPADLAVGDPATAVLALQGLDEEIESDVTDMFASSTSWALSCTC